MCDINLDKSSLWRARGRSQADSKEAIYTLMEGSEFSSSSRGPGREGAMYGTSPPVNEIGYSDLVGAPPKHEYRIPKRSGKAARNKLGRRSPSTPTGRKTLGIVSGTPRLSQKN